MILTVQVMAILMKTPFNYPPDTYKYTFKLLSLKEKWGSPVRPMTILAIHPTFLAGYKQLTTTTTKDKEKYKYRHG